MAISEITLTLKMRWWTKLALVLINLPNVSLVFRDGPVWAPGWLLRHGFRTEVVNGRAKH